MKLAAFCLVTLFALSANAHPGRPHPHPGPGPGPTSDACNAYYFGSFSGEGRPLEIEVQRRWGNQVTVTVVYHGAVWRTDGLCDRGGLEFDLQGYHHSGVFTYTRWGVDGMEGTVYVNGRPYQHFSLDRRG